MLSIAKLPEVLCLHIKRFAHNSYYSNKISQVPSSCVHLQHAEPLHCQHVKFPSANLNMEPFLARCHYCSIRLCPNNAAYTPHSHVKETRAKARSLSRQRSVERTPSGLSSGSSPSGTRQEQDLARCISPPSPLAHMASEDEHLYDLAAVVKHIGSAGGRVSLYCFVRC